MKKKKNIKLKNSDIFVCSICILGIIFSLFNYFSDIYQTANRSDIEPIAFVASKVKSVHRRFHDRLVWDMLKNNSALYAGDFVRTGEKSMAEIKFESGTLIFMQEDSLIEILPESEHARLLIAAGNVNINTAQKMRLMAGNEIIELAENSIINMTIMPLPEVEEITNTGIENANTNGVTNSNILNTANEKNNSTSKNFDKIKVNSKLGKKNSQISENDAIQNKQKAKTTACVVSIKVEQGKLSQSGQNGNVIEVNAGKEIVLNANKKVYTEPTLVITSPKAKHQIVKSLNDKANVEFEWESYNISNDCKLFVEIAYDEGFKYPYKTLQFNIEQNNAVFEDLPSRQMYWKAYPVENGENISKNNANLLQKGSISVYSVTPVKKLRPFNNAQLSYKGAKNGVTFAWTQDNFAKSYRLIIASDENFLKPIFTTTTAETSINIQDLPSGNLFWQVQSIYDENMQIGEVESEIFAFYVQAKPELLPPNCIKPANQEIHYTANGRQPLVFAWQNVNNAVEYTLYIADNPRLKNPLVQITTKELYFSLLPNKYNLSVLSEEKPLYWGVSYVDNEGTVSAMSKINSFYLLSEKPFLHCPAPANNFEIKLSEFKNILFEIESNLPINKTFVIAKDKNFSQIVLQAEISKNAFKVSSDLMAGEYYWRISCGKINSEVKKLILLADESENLSNMGEISENTGEEVPSDTGEISENAGEEVPSDTGEISEQSKLNGAENAEVAKNAGNVGNILE